tara:strand:- start:145 stop:1278 length:1134 start_codon:yes stop_codon:yes gene_type:complete
LNSEKKILVVAGALGSSKALIPVIYELIDRNIKVKIIASGLAFQILNELFSDKLTETADDISDNQALKLISDYKPHLVICGAGGNNKIEPIFRINAKFLNVFCFALVDNWCHPARRFFEVDASGEISNSIPDLIGLSNDSSYNEIIMNKEFDPEKIIVVGMPHVEETVKAVQLYTKREINKLFMNYNINRPVITFIFFSAPVEREIWDEIKQLSEIGYSEVSILEHIIHALECLCQELETSCQIIIKPHPSSSGAPFTDILDSKDSSEYISMQMVENAAVHELIILADGVLGMTSTSLFEAAMCKIPTFSVQIGLDLDRADTFNNIDGILSIYDYNSLYNELRSIFVKRNIKTDKSIDINSLSSSKMIVETLITNYL